MKHALFRFRLRRVGALGASAALAATTLVVVGGVSPAAADAACTSSAPAVGVLVTCQASQNVTIPQDAAAVQLTVTGAGGGASSNFATNTFGNGGAGAVVGATIPLDSSAPGRTLSVQVGSGGSGATVARRGGAGGQGSGVFLGSRALVIAGAGGGGGGGDTDFVGAAGGDAGLTNGSDGASTSQDDFRGTGGGGAHGAVGGSAGPGVTPYSSNTKVNGSPGQDATDGAIATGGAAAMRTTERLAGSGGGGYAGGGGGGAVYYDADLHQFVGGGGGGGSSYVDPGVTGTPTVQTGSRASTAGANGSAGQVVLTFLAAPTVDAISPNSGIRSGGTSVDITGHDFSSDATVTIGGRACTELVVVDDTRLRCTTPAGSGPADVEVDQLSGTGLLQNGFTFKEPPTVTGFSPNHGRQSGGGLLDIIGMNLDLLTAVRIGDAACTQLERVQGNEYTCRIPSGTAGASVDVTYFWGTGSDQNAVAGTYSYDPNPTVTAVDPTFGAPQGGTALTITGTDFLGDSPTVLVGDQRCQTPTIVSDTEITCTTASGGTSGDIVGVTVFVDNGTASLDDVFYLTDPMSLSGVAPSTGALAGGQQLTVSGTGIVAPVTVTVGGNACTNPVVADDHGSVSCTTPAGGVVGRVDVVVSGPNGTDTLANAWTYATAPTISGVSPSTGPVAGGTSITVSGSDFVQGDTVTIGGASCTDVLVLITGDQISCTTPAHAAGTVDVVVSGQTGTATRSDGFRYVAAPVISTISPDHGPAAGGTRITITGTDLGTASAVRVGGAGCTGLSVDSDSRISCTVPRGTAGDTPSVAVTTTGGTTSVSDKFSYDPSPQITAVDPSTGSTSGGTQITITGSNFAADSTVTVDDASCTNVQVVDSEHITCTTPAGSAGLVPVAVTAANGNVFNYAFTYVGPPAVSAVTPDAGPIAGGTEISISGLRLGTTSAVTVGGADCAITSVGATLVVCTTPAGTAGAAALVLSTQYGSATTSFTYLLPPAISSVSPNSGPSAGGTRITVTGTDFVLDDTVTIGSQDCTDPAVAEDLTSISCTTPAGAAGTLQDVVVSGPTGSGTLDAGFAYLPVPVIDSITPATGEARGGTTLFLAGTHFGPDSTVTVGGVVCGYLDVDADGTGLHCMTPGGDPGTAAVVVTDGNGSATSEDFSYVASVPSAPTNLLAVGGNASATVTFTVPEHDGGSPITGYEYSTVPGDGWRPLVDPVVDGTQVAAVVSDLTPGTQYAFRMRAVNDLGHSSRVDGNGFATPYGIPAAVQGFSATPGNGSANLFWSAPASDGGSPVLRYEYSTDGLVWHSLGTNLGGIAGDLANGVTYTVSLRAVNAAGAGPSVSTTVTPGVPMAPVGVTPTAGDGMATLTFAAPPTADGTPVLFYEYTLDGGDNWLPLATSGGPVTTGPTTTSQPTTVATTTETTSTEPTTAGVRFLELQVLAESRSLPDGLVTGTITGLQNGVTYHVQVRAVNASGPGVASEPIEVTPFAVAPTTPTTPTTPVTSTGTTTATTGATSSAPMSSSGGSTSAVVSTPSSGGPATTGATDTVAPTSGSAAEPQLSYTGLPAGTLIGIGLSVLLAGAGLLLLGYRRRQH